jgi:conjugal transfer mating pair stabilization protein TraN
MLQTLREMQKQYSTDPITVFKGTEESCKKKAYGFNNCCKSGKSWVERAHLSECSASDKALIEKNSKELCHYVGSYKKKQFGITKYRKEVFCCFDSQLVKQIHLGGRHQIGRGFGSAHNPDCGGFSVNDLQRIDFSKIDFSPLVNGILNSVKKHEVVHIKSTLENELRIIKEGVCKVENDGEKEELKGRNKKYDKGGIL